MVYTYESGNLTARTECALGPSIYIKLSRNIHHKGHNLSIMTTEISCFKENSGYKRDNLMPHLLVSQR